jgi:hypothetical protein
VETARGKTRDETISRLADRIDKYEKYSRPHSRVMAGLAVRLARRMGLSHPDVNALAEAAWLHDIGLYTMNPPYHSSPGPLSFEQRLDLWRHPIIGEQQMAKSEATRQAQLLVRWHHEWWNGTGYPDMLAFEDIPIGARILRAVELYSALISDRPYRDALSEEQAIEALKSAAGVECDPYVVKALLALLEDLRSQAAREQGADGAGESAGDLPAIAEASPSPSDFTQPADETLDMDVAMENSLKTQPLAPVSKDTREQTVESSPLAGCGVSDALQMPAPRPSPASIEALLSRPRSKDAAMLEAGQWRGWTGSRYNRKSLLGFEASVLRQIDFRSIAIALCGWARLDWYLKVWGKLIMSNDPRGWAAAASRSLIEARTPLGEEQVAELLTDLYVPAGRLANPALRRWFGESDAWWMDNLRRNIDRIEDPLHRAQAIMLGVQTGDYALSFNDETREIKRPLTTIYWRLAGRATLGPQGHPHNRSYNLPVEEFIRQSRADLLYLSLPPSHAEMSGSEARNEWREAWVKATDGASIDDMQKLMIAPQSKHTYLTLIDRLLRAGAHIRSWAIQYQDVGLASAHDISELIKDHRAVRATYSKDLTEVAGGLRNYIIVAERS